MKDELRDLLRWVDWATDGGKTHLRGDCLCAHVEQMIAAREVPPAETGRRLGHEWKLLQTHGAGSLYVCRRCPASFVVHGDAEPGDPGDVCEGRAPQPQAEAELGTLRAYLETQSAIPDDCMEFWEGLARNILAEARAIAREEIAAAKVECAVGAPDDTCWEPASEFRIVPGDL